MSEMEKKYLDILAKVLKEGKPHSDRTGTGTIRLFSHAETYDLTTGKFPLITTKKMNLRLVAEELIWMLAGSTDEKGLAEKKVNIWAGNASKEECAKFGRAEGDLGPIYGHQWRNYGASMKTQADQADSYSAEKLRWVNRAYNNDGHDQIKSLVEGIQKNPDSRRLIVNAWNPAEANLVNPPPCHSFFHVQIESGKVNLLLYQRSSDLFLGVPFNLAFYSLLTQLLAMVTNLEVGTFSHHMGDLHIYKDHIEQCNEQISREPFESPVIKINERLRGKGLQGLMDFRFEDVELIDYKSHASIKGKMSV